MTKRDARREAWRIAAQILERNGDDPTALYVGGTGIHGYYERSADDVARMRAAWAKVVDECWRRAGGADRLARRLRPRGEI